MRYPWFMPQEQSALCGQNMAHPVVSLVWEKQEGTGPAVTNPKGFLSLWTSLLKEYGSRTNRKLSTIGKSFCSFTYEKKKKKKLALLSRGCTPVSQALSPGPFLELLPRGLSRRALAILCWNVSLLLDSSVLIIFTCYF